MIVIKKYVVHFWPSGMDPPPKKIPGSAHDFVTNKFGVG